MSDPQIKSITNTNITDSHLFPCICEIFTKFECQKLVICSFLHKCFLRHFREARVTDVYRMIGRFKYQIASCIYVTECLSYSGQLFGIRWHWWLLKFSAFSVIHTHTVTNKISKLFSKWKTTVGKGWRLVILTLMMTLCFSSHAYCLHCMLPVVISAIF